jgi:hypothetical protein
MTKKATVSNIRTTGAPPASTTNHGRPLFKPGLGIQAWSLLLVMGCAGFLRLLWLGRPAFRADTIHFWSMAQQKLTFGDVWSRWLQLLGDSAQFPLSAALAMIPTSALGLPVTAMNVRLSDAFFGVVAVGAAWLAGRWLGGRWFGTVCAVFIAINPLHLQLSREAYFYSPLVAGGFILLACTARAIRYPRSAWSLGWMLLWVCGLALTAYSHFTGWILAGLVVLVTVLKLAVSSSPGATRWPAAVLTVCASLVALPLTWLPWALPYTLKRMADPNAKAESIRVMGAVKTQVPEMLVGYAEKMMWGSSGWAIALLLLSALALLAALMVGARRARLRWLAGLGVAGLGAYLVVMKSQGMYEAVRHVSFLFPLVTVLSLYGLWSLPRLKGIRHVLGPQGRPWVGWGLMALALLTQLPGTWAALRITGNPTPYRDIQAWFDQHLASGTPVLVDRWFEPWNELRAHPTTNVVFTFTRPNEPLDVFLQSRWRDGAEQFLRANPDAAYLEIAKSYAQEPGVGPWRWPGTYFKQHVRLVNAAGLVLRERGQAFREDFYAADTNRLVVEIFYNAREDVLALARAESRSLVVWPGAGWQFVKSGPVAFLPLQTADFMDWRIMDNEAVLELHNVADQAQTVHLIIRGSAVRSPKTVEAAGVGQFTFQPGRISEWRTPPIVLPPGLTTLRLRDPWTTSGPLLVQQWMAVPASATSAANAPGP